MFETGPKATQGARAAPLLFSALIALAGASACAGDAGHPAVLDRSKIPSIVVGRSTQGDVFALLGRPSRAERSAQAETWIYEDKASGGEGRLVSGAAAASGIVGAFVPYVGLLGSGLGLADAATGGARPQAATTSFAVSFGDGGIVRDCVYATTEFSSAPGRAPGIPRSVDCQRPSDDRLPPSVPLR